MKPVISNNVGHTQSTCDKCGYESGDDHDFFTKATFIDYEKTDEYEECPECGHIQSV